MGRILKGTEIRELRALLGWTAEMLAGRAKISMGTVYNAEKGNSIAELSRTALYVALAGGFKESGLPPPDKLRSAFPVTEFVEPAEAQLVRWGPVDHMPPGICIGDCKGGTFVPWIDLKIEVEDMLLPQVRRVPIGSTVQLRDLGDRKNWIVRIINPKGLHIGEIWFGPDADSKWKWDGLVRVGGFRVEGPDHRLVWQVFQRYSDGSYRRVEAHVIE